MQRDILPPSPSARSSAAAVIPLSPPPHTKTRALPGGRIRSERPSVHDERLGSWDTLVASCNDKLGVLVRHMATSREPRDCMSPSSLLYDLRFHFRFNFRLRLHHCLHLRIPSSPSPSPSSSSSSPPRPRLRLFRGYASVSAFTSSPLSPPLYPSPPLHPCRSLSRSRSPAPAVMHIRGGGPSDVAGPP